MKRLFYPGDSIENKISYYHLVGFLVTLPYDRFYSTLILWSPLIHVAIHFRRHSVKPVGHKIWILQSVFYVSVVSAVYAPSFAGAANIVAKQLAIFLFPVLFAIISLDLARYRPVLLMTFATGCTFTVLYLFTDAFRVIFFNHLPPETLFSAAFVNHNFSLPIGMHATYLSAFLVISLVCFLERLLSDRRVSRRIFFIGCCVVLAGGLLQLGSKSAWIALLVILNVGFPFFLLSGRKRYRFLVIALAVSLLLLALVLSVQVFRDRFINDLTKDLYEKPQLINQFSRIDRWDAAGELIQRAPVIGSGTGSEIALLKDIYFERKMYASYLNSMNVHNQYLSFLINSGIIGLVIYLGTLFWGLQQSIKKRDLLLFSFLVLVIIVSFGEDLLDVNKGIFFYAFFFSFLMFSGTVRLPAITLMRSNP